MKLWLRVVLFTIVVGAAWAGEGAYVRSISRVNAALSVAAVNGGERQLQALQDHEAEKNEGLWAFGAVVVFAGIVLFGTYKPRPYVRYVPALALIGVVGAGCWKPYDKPEYQDVDTSETAFLIPIEGDSTQQAKFQSVAFLENAKVAAKRVQITHRWDQTGRANDDGSWIANVRLVKVKRTPVTRLWTKETSTGTSGKNEAVHVESQDSIGFTMGWTCTAMITEENTATFLYYYPAGSLEAVMDTEVLSRIQSVTQDICAKYTVNEVRTMKAEIHKAVQEDLTKFYSQRGVTITNVGIYGGFTYENPEIQKSMDEAAMAANLKEIESQKLLAQKTANERVALEATGRAEAAKLEAQGKADAILAEKTAEAKGIQLVNQALNDAKQNPLLIQMKLLEIKQTRASKWDGRYPTWYFGGGSTSGAGMPNLMVNIPAPTDSH
jgi:regulator of protease activity HflC (stomatin/prohibitin superfamily)